MHAKPGDDVKAGDPLLTLYTDEADRIEPALAALSGGYRVARPGTSLAPRPLIIDRIS